MRFSSMAGLVFLCVAWGSTWLGIRICLEDMPPLGSAALRFLIAAAFVGLLARGRRLPAADRPGIGLWLALSATLIVLPYGLIYNAEQTVPSGVASVLFATYPLFIGVLTQATGLESPPGWRGWGGLLAGFLGVAVLFQEDWTAAEMEFVGGGLVLASAAASAVGSLLVRTRMAHVDPLLINLRPMLIGGLALGAMSFATETDATWRWSARGMGALLYLALVGSTLAFAVYFRLMRTVPLSRLAMITYVTPVVALLLGATLGEEEVTSRTLAGTALILTGIALARRPALRSVAGRATMRDPMAPLTRGRPTGADIFKPGERCQRAGAYRCENCRRRGTDTRADVAAGAIFPMCSQCKDLDMGWRLEAGAKR